MTDAITLRYWQDARPKPADLWVWLHGPEGTSKAAFVRHLHKGWRADETVVVQLDLAGSVGRRLLTDPAYLLPAVLEVAGLRAGASDEPKGNGFWLSLDAAHAAGPNPSKRLVVVLSGCDEAFLSASMRQMLVSTFNDERTKRSGKACVLSVASLPLTVAMTVINDQSPRPGEGFREVQARFLPLPDVESGGVDRLVTWCEPQIDPSIARSTLVEIAKRVLEATEGHPVLASQLALSAVKAFMSGVPVARAAVRSAEDQLQEAPERLRGILSPLLDRPVDQHFGSEFVGLMRAAIDLVLASRRGQANPDDQLAALAHGLGLSAPAFEGTYLPAATPFTALAFDNTFLEQRSRDLETWRSTLASRERRHATRANTQLLAVRELVEEQFCRSDRGRARNISIEPGSEAVHIDGKYYSLTLLSSAPGSQGQETTRSGEFAAKKLRRSHLKIFLGLHDDYARLWDRELRLLMDLSAIEHPAIPNIRENGRLEEEVDGGRLGFGYILLEDEGQPVDTHVRAMLRDPKKKAIIHREIRSLFKALTEMQKRSIVHRTIMPSRLHWRSDHKGDIQLILSGFDLAASAYLSSEHPALGEANLPGIDQRDALHAVVGGVRNRIFFEPAAQNVFFTADPWRSAYLPQSDVFSLSMTLCDLLYGPPADGLMVEFEASTNADEAKDAQRKLIEAYRRDIRARPCDTVSPELRDILLEGLEPDARRRMTAVDLQQRLFDGRIYLENFYNERDGRKYIVAYNKNLMLQELRRSPASILDFNPDAEEAPERLHRLLQQRLTAASRVLLDPDGCSRFVSKTEANDRHAASKIVIVSGEICFYCSYYSRAGNLVGGSRAEDTRVLYLGYVFLSRGNALVALVPEFYSVPFPNSDFILEPADAHPIKSGELDGLSEDGRPIGHWNVYLEALRTTRISKDHQRAIDALTFVAEIASKQRRLIQFPVQVEPALHSDNHCYVVLREDEFTQRVDRDKYLRLLYAEHSHRTARGFFQFALREWLENSASGPEAAIAFRQDGTGATVRLRFRPQDIEGGRILVRRNRGIGRLAARTAEALEGEGQLRFSDDRGIESQYEVQTEAIARLRHRPELIDQLNRPRATMLLLRKKPKGFAPTPSEDTSDKVWDMLSASPLYTLHGPPGTGKTTVLSAFIESLLDSDETASALLTSQSNAAVDNTLRRVVSKLKSGYPDALDHFHVVRHMPAYHTPQISDDIAGEFDVPGLMRRVTAHVRRTASEEMARLERRPIDDTRRHALRRKALEQLEGIPERAPEELERRVQRNASLHFATTATATQDKIDVSGRRDSFSVVVIEEAARALGTEMVAPLLFSRKQILLGDHKQLPPFDAERIRRLAAEACGGQVSMLAARERREAEPIFPQYVLDEERKAFVAWLETFRRIFRDFESNNNQMRQDGAPVGGMLTRQFRSVEPIGDLVSDVFYGGDVKFGGRVSIPEDLVISLDSAGLGMPEDMHLVWYDTSLQSSTLFRTQTRGDGRLENAGEAGLILRLLREGKFNADEILGRTSEPLNEQLLIMSPYRSQVELIRRQLKETPGRHGFSATRESALAQIDTVTSTIDGSQGAEANCVIVSLVRSAVEQGFPDHDRRSLADDWDECINRNYGFTINPERMNVMLSRARHQLIIVGDFNHYQRFSEAVREWAGAYKGSSEGKIIQQEYGFWEKLIGYFINSKRTIQVGKHYKGTP